ncbi:glucose-6-phosphate isomerase [Motiliproteus sp. SC1-56]|uniref:glucose-6-phosphate isomerase n=1 Tax=Motiliproteus sp. SC1-56 TaxID=2799565 RepID=UPI001A8CD1E1|nr:glucose-6-phosphate isomerase [Motiliproteus sp. SC1-56]
MSVRQSPAWQALERHYREAIEGAHLHQLFSADPDRFDRFSVSEQDYLLDFSKHRITEQSFQLLLRLAEQQQLRDWIDRLFEGAPVNSSEQRSALHTALRAPAERTPRLAGEAIAEAIHGNLARMGEMVAQIHSGHWRGYSGKAITDVVNLGVGGSDLGPFMACHALEEFRDPRARGLQVHFVSSIDGSQLAELLKRLNPETTLFVLSSKSFTTIDTLSNAETAKGWLAQKISDESILIGQHFIGCSARPEKMSEWGIPVSNQLQFWDWVGGRFSLWSVIGLPIALLIGMDGFRQLLAGAHAIDQHFREAPFERNLPVIMALLGVWTGNFIGVKGHSVLPYDGRLKFLPNYLTQLEMESNGKSVTRGGERVDYDTCPIIWGEVGPNAQHAYYQLLHQGTQPVSCDFIAPVRRYRAGTAAGTRAQLQSQQQLNLANCLAQSRVLMFGDQALPVEEREGRRSDQHYEGNQCSTTLLIKELTPATLGGLVALYEHKVFVQSVIWEINPFDQWGVELGKQIAKETHRAIAAGEGDFDDSSTRGLLAFIQRVQR